MFSACSAPTPATKAAPERHYVYDVDDQPKHGHEEEPAFLGCGSPTRHQDPNDKCYLPSPLVNERRHGDNQGQRFSPRHAHGEESPCRHEPDAHLPDHRGFVEHQYEVKRPQEPPVHPLDPRNHQHPSHEMLCYEANTHLDSKAVYEEAKNQPGDRRRKAHEENQRCAVDNNVRRDGDAVDRYIDQYYRHAAPSYPVRQSLVSKQTVAATGRARIVSTAFGTSEYKKNMNYNYGSAVRRGQAHHPITDNKNERLNMGKYEPSRRASGTTLRCHKACGGIIRTGTH
eukprot:GEMP01038842.1.p1 GENE.GEMP01038842.1~~GEMP01038842.1.p1  ORF type:complete len:285 (+),score=59.14 GEMP01038842.1:202-1056(+)